MILGPADRELLARMLGSEKRGEWWQDSDATLRLEQQGLAERYEMGPARAPSWRVTAAWRKAVEEK